MDGLFAIWVIRAQFVSMIGRELLDEAAFQLFFAGNARVCSSVARLLDLFAGFQSVSLSEISCDSEICFDFGRGIAS
jgi:hypothetical protein